MAFGRLQGSQLAEPQPNAGSLVGPQLLIALQNRWPRGHVADASPDASVARPASASRTSLPEMPLHADAVHTTTAAALAMAT